MRTINIARSNGRVDQYTASKWFVDDAGCLHLYINTRSDFGRDIPQRVYTIARGQWTDVWYEDSLRLAPRRTD